MIESPSAEAWNNFVLNSQISDYGDGDVMRSAAIAKLYMNQANNGGINSFLTYSYEYDASEVLEALRAVGAFAAAMEFEHILRMLDVPLPRSSEEARSNLLDQHWSDAMDTHDILASDADLMRALERHVREHEHFYLSLE